ncbi:hypothetical protein HDU83_008586 [Entophlyctis luteolus]|nr:hypothetical protein HDU82_003826 [Entophlyctis luteolus]KAJ3337609.1 hypothetical protein HDU83_008586 [Entophlyctis luteolus]KAJ3374209.1 hypothetical protein HDU84_000918 [Entophlyctis sp. JEL0112]
MRAGAFLCPVALLRRATASASPSVCADAKSAVSDPEADTPLLAAATSGAPERKRQCRHRVHGIVFLLLVLAWIILRHICPHYRRGHPTTHHIFLETNGTVVSPPKALVLHFDDHVDPTTVNLRWHLYQRNTTSPLLSRHFTKCAPSELTTHTAVFGPECVDISANYANADPGTTLTYAVIGFGKRLNKPNDESNGGHSADPKDNGDDDDALDDAVTWHADMDSLVWGPRRFYLLTKVRLEKS